MDPIVIGGVLIVIASIVIATLIDGNSLGVLIGPSAFVLVIFGTVGAAILAYRLQELRKLPQVVRVALTGSPPELDDTVTTLAELADVARREGMLALEARLEEVEDPALRSALQLLVDGLDAEQVREMMQIDIIAVEERHRVGIGFFKSMGGYAPTFGMLGTVIGLVNMLQNLTDPQQLGIGMALALLTTLYGVITANVLWLPIAARLERLNEIEIGVREAALDGVLALQSGLSPRMLVERLETFLPPEQRIGYQARAAGGRRSDSKAA